MTADFTIRALASADQALLFDMLYLAIFVPQGDDPPPRDVVYGEALRKYAADFGRAGDMGFAAVEADGDAPLGAVWLRLFSDQKPGYGFVDEETPELTIAVTPAARGKGIGSALLRRVLEAAAERYGAISLSIWPENPAYRLYQRFGFEAVEEAGFVVTMVKELR